MPFNKRIIRGFSIAEVRRGRKALREMILEFRMRRLSMGATTCPQLELVSSENLTTKVLRMGMPPEQRQLLPASKGKTSVALFWEESEKKKTILSYTWGQSTKWLIYPRTITLIVRGESWCLLRITRERVSKLTWEEASKWKATLTHLMRISLTSLTTWRRFRKNKMRIRPLLEIPMQLSMIIKT